MPLAAHASRWRREPHRLLFPLGATLGVFAVLPFAWRGASGASLALFHSVAQIQGFLTCFLAGFLLTLVPRLTRTSPASGWEIGAAALLPAVASLSGWVGDPATASWLWLALVLIVTGFTTSRLRARPAAVPLAPILLWVPASVVAGAIGALLVAGGPGLPIAWAFETWTVGRGLLVQGFVSGLVLGIGGFLLPAVTRGEAARQPPHAIRRRVLALHAAAAAVFFGSFLAEVWVGSPAGFAVRAVVAFAVLLGAARLYRPPSLAGLHRWLAWLAAWLVPVAFVFGAVAPRFRGAALHVLFVGGFAQLTLAMSAAIVLGGEGRAAPAGAAVGIRAMAAMLAAAFTARIAATIHLGHVADWLRIAAFAFCAAVAAWAAVVAPSLLARTPIGAPNSAARGR